MELWWFCKEVKTDKSMHLISEYIHPKGNFIIYYTCLINQLSMTCCGRRNNNNLITFR